MELERAAAVEEEEEEASACSAWRASARLSARWSRPPARTRHPASAAWPRLGMAERSFATRPSASTGAPPERPSTGGCTRPHTPLRFRTPALRRMPCSAATSPPASSSTMKSSSAEAGAGTSSHSSASAASSSSTQPSSSSSSFSSSSSLSAVASRSNRSHVKTARMGGVPTTFHAPSSFARTLGVGGGVFGCGGGCSSFSTRTKLAASASAGDATRGPPLVRRARARRMGMSASVKDGTFRSCSHSSLSSSSPSSSSSSSNDFVSASFFLLFCCWGDASASEPMGAKLTSPCMASMCFRRP
mmetsp:Transcript_6859/g.22779  ORF Transcript_6859/g.22779 Transcript_6859/m.22779 type:complete len:302 (-) Transcript_6859:631-1536(-)